MGRISIDKKRRVEVVVVAIRPWGNINVSSSGASSQHRRMGRWNVLKSADMLVDRVRGEGERMKRKGDRGLFSSLEFIPSPSPSPSLLQTRTATTDWDLIGVAAGDTAIVCGRSINSKFVRKQLFNGPTSEGVVIRIYLGFGQFDSDLVILHYPR